ncbi:hypothetical protein JT55_17550 [Rhodovulum sp. NI22]|jgi:hypothetical protein|nr:hypothetical protein JT55_17550 [Rhodovulum sp. NI22]
MRIAIFDGFRGFFLLFMMIIHANVELHAILGKLNHHYFGWVEDAQGFVFISGFVVGLVYGNRLLKRGFASCKSAIWRRIRTIYTHQATLIVIFLAAALLLAAFGLFPAILAPYRAEPVGFTAASLALISGSKHMGILPMYIWFMMLTPFILEAFRRNYAGFVLSLSALLWFLAQTGLIEVVVQTGELALAGLGHPIRLGIFFNVFGWQVLFVGGLYLGLHSAAGTLDLSFLKNRQWQLVFCLALGAFFFLGIYDRVVFHELLGHEFSEAVFARTDRGNFSLIYPIAFIVDLFIVTWLVVAGEESRVRLFQKMSAFVQWLFTRRFLVFLGQHSLHVFSAHVLVVYVLAIVVEYYPPGPLWREVLILLTPIPLYLAAWGHARLQRKTTAKAQRVPASQS